jgi:hypothetical protein
MGQAFDPLYPKVPVTCLTSQVGYSVLFMQLCIYAASEHTPKNDADQKLKAYIIIRLRH